MEAVTSKGLEIRAVTSVRLEITAYDLQRESIGGDQEEEAAKMKGVDVVGSQYGVAMYATK